MNTYPCLTGSRLTTRTFPTVLRRALGAVGAFAILLVLGCGGENGTGPGVVATVVVTPATVTLNAFGATAQLVPTGNDKSGNAVQGTTFTFESTPASVATVSATGLVTAVSNGVATIRVSVGTVFAEVQVTVLQTASEIVITPASVPTFTAVGQTAQVTASVRDAQGNVMTNQTIQWTSLNNAAISVSPQTGATVTLTAVANGTASISATAGTLSRSVTATVAQAVNSVTVTPAAVSLSSINQTSQLTPEARDSRNNIVMGATFVWQSNNPAAATVSPTGLVTAQGTGSATITATSGTANGTATVTVNQAVANVSLVITPTSIQVGQTASYTVTATDALNNPVSGANATVISSNPNVATVAPTSGSTPLTGTLTATGGGTATISVNVGAITGSASLTVQNPTVTVTPATATLRSFGEPATFTASSAPGQTITVSSSNPNVVTVAPVSGSSPLTFTATAIGNGTATVTASSGSNSGSATATVSQEAATLTVTPSPSTLASIGASVTLTATALDARNNPVSPITWTSSNANFVGVAPTTGQTTTATAVANGTATITATAGSNNRTGTGMVTVAQVACSVTGTPPVLNLVPGASANVAATARDCNQQPIPTGVTFNWTSSNTPVATVSSATGPTTTVTAVSNGAATIIITETGSNVQGQVPVGVGSTVDSVSVTKMTPAESDTIHAVGNTPCAACGTLQLQAQAFQGGAPIAGRTFNWASSTPAVATVSATGLVTAVTNGTVTITATETQSNKSGVKTVIVFQVPILPFTITPGSATLSSLTETAQLTTAPVDSNNNAVPVVWTSSNTTVATVNSQTGLVTAVKNGSATVTANANNFIASASVTVQQVVNSITLSPATRVTLQSNGPGVAVTATLRDARNQPVTGVVPNWATTSHCGVAAAACIGPITSVAPATGTTVTVTAATAMGTPGLLTPRNIVGGMPAAPHPDDTLFVTAPGGFRAAVPVTVSPQRLVIAPVPAGPLTITNAGGTLTLGATPQDARGVIFDHGTGAAGAAFGAGAADGFADFPITSVIAQMFRRFTLMWTSSNTAVATVNPTTGVVTAVANGTTTISAVENEYGVAATAVVTVTGNP